MFIFGTIGAIPLIMLRLKIPESPRWLLTNGNYKLATIIINKIKEAVSFNAFTIAHLSDEDPKEKLENSLQSNEN